MKPIAYFFLNAEHDWMCELVTDCSTFDGNDEGWYLAGVVNSLGDLFDLMEANDFDPEYFYNFVDRLPHGLYNALNTY